MDVSIIIVNWNTKNLVYNCLKSIYENGGKIDFEVIVIDNASADGSKEMIRSEFPDVILIENHTNQGFAAANNQGMKISRGRYVLLLNSDTVICDGAIVKSVAYADNHPDVAVVGCQVWKNQHTIQMTCFGFPSITNLFFRMSGLSKIFSRNRVFGREWMAWWLRDSERQVDIISGMFMLVRRVAIDEVGFMDETFFFYSEEVDWCYRFSKAGWKMMFWPGAKIIHVHGGGQSSKKIPVKSYVQQVKSELLLFKKHQGRVAFSLARLMFSILYSLKYFLWLIGRVIKSKKAKNTANELDGQKAWCALKFTVFGIEPGKSTSKIMTLLRRRMIGFIEFLYVLVYYVFLAITYKKIRRVVIYYHDVQKENIEQFEKQIRYLANTYRVVKVSEINTFASNGEDALVAIMFDDAFSSIMKNALPILRKYGLYAGFCIPTGHLGHQPKWPVEGDYYIDDEFVVSEHQIQELDREGFEILSHSVSHTPLTQLDDDTLLTELVDSKQALERIVCHEVVGICYPYGANNEKVCRTAKKVGYQLGFVIEPYMVSESSDNFRIGRFFVSPKDSLLKFKLKVCGAYQIAKYLRKIKRLFIQSRGIRFKRNTR